LALFVLLCVIWPGGFLLRMCKRNFMDHKTMYLRVKSTPNSPRKSIQIVESVRTGDKVKQKIIHHVGIALDEREEQKLKDYGLELIAKITAKREQEAAQQTLFYTSEPEIIADTKKKLGRKSRKKIEDILPPSQVTLTDIVEEKRVVEGVHDIAGAMFDEMYQGIFKGKRSYSLLRDVVLSRLIYPCSKRRTQEKLFKHFDKKHSLEMIYWMMDQVFPKISQIKQMTFAKTASLFPEKVDLILFDVTTLYFESVEADELRNYGYSKDHRFNTTQVVLALATNQDGLPVGYELFEGNKAEVTTLAAAIESWKNLFKIDSVCFVGDRAMFSKSNIALLESLNYQYIIAAKLKSLPDNLKTKILDEQYYKPTVINNEFAWVGEFEYQSQRLVTSYKSRRAMKDLIDRQRVLDKVTKTIGKQSSPKKLITNQGVKKFVTVNDEASASLDETKINDAAQWDGLHGIITNIRDDSPISLIARYAKLWVIEESFRVNKHTLKMRPIFHWAPPRIHAHIAICYMTFSVLRHLQYRINLTQKITIDTILDELMNIQASIYVHKKTKDRYRVPGVYSNNARKIYKAFSLERSLDATIYLT
jgi:transposase